MPRRSLLSTAAREAFFNSPTDHDGLTRHYLLSPADLDLIRSRRRDENRFGLAVHLALLRHPGQGWLDGTVLPSPLIDWLGGQLGLPSEVVASYAERGVTRSTHHMLAMQHLDLTPFTPKDAVLAADIASTAAFATDHGAKIVGTLIAGLRARRLVLPSADTIERLALKGGPERAERPRQRCAARYHSNSKPASKVFS